MATDNILDFQNLDFLTVRRVRRVNLRHGAKFHHDRSNHCLDMAIFRLFKMSAAVILEFQNLDFLTIITGQEDQPAARCQIS